MINDKLRQIGNDRNIPKKPINLLLSHNTRLSTARVMVKTHKYNSEELKHLDPNTMKTRPIVSGCNSPFNKALWFICHMLSPLMKLTPTHLENTHQFLTQLNAVPKSDREQLSFFTADVEALYTNINVTTAIDDIMEFAYENKHHLITYGLKLSDIHELLEITLGNSYFVYNRQIYQQLQGLFMGSNPAPELATVRMWKLERNSVYVDLRIKLPYYGRFYDDLGGITNNRRKAQQLCNSIEDQDKDHLIKLKLDYPSSSDQYTPFLNTEIKLEKDGTINSRMYRKPQNKLITLHRSSHHTKTTKEATINSMYKTADTVSSNQENKDYSSKLVDTLLLNNGYNKRVLDKIKTKNKKKQRSNKARPNINDCVNLKLPYLNDVTSRKFKDAVKHSGLPIRVIETPGRKLRDILTDSRPRDKPQCPQDNCRSCNAMEKGKCTSTNVVYCVTCLNNDCNESYIGETQRPLYNRFTEHYRNADNPTAPSYINTPMAKHYSGYHANKKPNLKLEIIDVGKSLVNRKIKEAKNIMKFNPSINNQSELIELKQFLITE